MVIFCISIDYIDQPKTKTMFGRQSSQTKKKRKKEIPHLLFSRQKDQTFSSMLATSPLKCSKSKRQRAQNPPSTPRKRKKQEHLLITSFSPLSSHPITSKIDALWSTLPTVFQFGTTCTPPTGCPTKNNVTKRPCIIINNNNNKSLVQLIFESLVI